MPKIKYYESALQKGKKINSREVVDEIRDFGKEMRITNKDVSEMYGVTLEYASEMLGLALEEGLHQRIERLTLGCYDEGRSLRETAILAGIRISEVEKILRRSGRTIRDEPAIGREDLAKLILESDERKKDEIEEILDGRSVHQIGRKFGYSGENARLRIHDYGLYGNWMQARKERSEEQREDNNKLENERNKLIDLMRNKNNNLLNQNSKLERKAFRYAEAYYVPSGKISFKEIYDIFKSYFELKASDLNYLKEIVEKSNSRYFYCAGLLSKAGLRVRKRNKAMLLKAS